MVRNDEFLRVIRVGVVRDAVCTVKTHWLYIYTLNPENPQEFVSTVSPPTCSIAYVMEEKGEEEGE